MEKSGIGEPQRPGTLGLTTLSPARPKAGEKTGLLLMPTGTDIAPCYGNYDPNAPTPPLPLLSSIYRRESNVGVAGPIATLELNRYRCFREPDRSCLD